jgi:hypothetical protein
MRHEDVWEMSQDGAEKVTGYELAARFPARQEFFFSLPCPESYPTGTGSSFFVGKEVRTCDAGQ